MPISCCAIGCTNRQGYPGKRFFFVSERIKNKGESGSVPSNEINGLHRRILRYAVIQVSVSILEVMISVNRQTIERAYSPGLCASLTVTLVKSRVRSVHVT